VRLVHINIEHYLGAEVVLGIAEVALVVELLVKGECERGVERGGMRYAVCGMRLRTLGMGWVASWRKGGAAGGDGDSAVGDEDGAAERCRASGRRG